MSLTPPAVIRPRPLGLLGSSVILLLIGLVALLSIVGMTFWLNERASDYFSDVIQARDTRSAAVSMRNAMLTAESSQRGFLFTGNEVYLAPYGVAKSQAQRQLEILRQLLVNYPETQGSVDRLQVLQDEKFAEIEQTIAFKRNRQDAEALALVRTNRGKAVMDEANVFFSGVIRDADARLTAGVSEQNANANWLRLVSIVGGVIIVVVVGVAALVMLRYTRSLAAARDEVAGLNQGLEARVRERTTDLITANQEIQRFAYIVTHDLRAPLVNIMGFTSELEDGVATMQALIEKTGAGADMSDPVAVQARIAAVEDLPEAIGFIRSSTRRMDGLINAILKLSREGQRALRPEAVDLAEVARSSAGILQHRLVETGGAIDLDIDVPTLQSDRMSLEQVLGNLLDNAVKYRSSLPPHIIVRARRFGANRVRIEIADNGRGIAAPDQERVFELFRRSGAQDQAGEGIGLAFVKTVVRNLGGTVTLTSVLGEGTIFIIDLPVALPAFGDQTA